MPEHILIADDQKSMQDLLTDLLKQRGAEAVAVGTAEEGLEMISKNPDAFDLVILDLDFSEENMNGLSGSEENMNGLSGLEGIKKINSALPVIILTGKGTISTAVEAIKLGAEEYVEKDWIFTSKRTWTSHSRGSTTSSASQSTISACAVNVSSTVRN